MIDMHMQFKIHDIVPSLEQFKCIKDTAVDRIILENFGIFKCLSKYF